MSEETSWREVIVDVEPRQKEFRVAVEEKVGQPNVSFVLMRKSTGNTALPPAATFGSLEPPLEANERFKLDACAQVG